MKKVLHRLRLRAIRALVGHRPMSFNMPKSAKPLKPKRPAPVSLPSGPQTVAAPVQGPRTFMLAVEGDAAGPDDAAVQAERARVIEQDRRRRAALPQHLQPLADFLRAGAQTPVDEHFARMTCAMCGSADLLLSDYPDNRSLYFANMSVVSCAGCGVSYVPSRPKALGLYYHSLYSMDKGRPIKATPEELWSGAHDKKLAVDRSARHLAIARVHVPEIATMVDVGAGYGAALKVSGATRKIAVEVDASMTPYLEYLGAERFETCGQIDSGIADVVVSSHYLEHLFHADIEAELQQMMRILRPGGVAVIEVPNASLLRFGPLGARHAPHLVFFSAQSLRALAEGMNTGSVEIRRAGASGRPVVTPAIYCPVEEDDIRHSALVAVIRKVM